MTPQPESAANDVPPPPGVWERWRRLGRLTLKEMREILRDRRTIVTLVLMPVLVYPLLSIAFQQFILTGAGDVGPPKYVIGLHSTQQLELLQAYLNQYGDPTPPPQTPSTAGVPPAQPEIEPVRATDLRAAVRDGQIDLGIEINLQRETGFTPTLDLSGTCELIFDETSATGFRAAEYYRTAIEAANRGFLERRLKELNVSQPAVPIEAKLIELPAEESVGGVSLTSVIPLILILMTITGAVYPAIDLTAGERERGTLEILIAAPIPRLGLLIAKYMAVLTVAMLTATVNLLMMAVTVSVSGLAPQLLGESGLSPQLIVQVFCLLLLFAMFFSAVLLTLTSFARSFKEAQAYLIPLMLLSLAPGILSLMPGLKLSGVLAVVPLVNIVLLGRDLMHSNVELASLVAVIVSTSIYSLVAIAIAGKIFGAEGVLYSTPGSWSDLLRRPDHATDTPSLTNAMFCLACLFPAYFIVSRLSARAEDLDPTLRAILSAVATASLFGLFPLIAALLGRVRLLSAFAITRPSIVAIIGAALLGLSLWPFAYEFTLATRSFQLDDRFAEMVRDITERLQALNPVLLVFAFAVVPATFEELCFRGYLFNAIRPRTSPLQTILATAILFGLFHFVTQGTLSMERLANSTALGVVLGWIRYRSGSIWPGIVMHVCHNGFLLVIASFQEELEARFPQFRDEQHLPAVWLIAAGIVALVGGGLVYVATRRRAITAEPS